MRPQHPTVALLAAFVEAAGQGVKAEAEEPPLEGPVPLRQGPLAPQWPHMVFATEVGDGGEMYERHDVAPYFSCFQKLASRRTVDENCAFHSWKRQGFT